jgi:hypothetical protein
MATYGLRLTTTYVSKCQTLLCVCGDKTQKLVRAVACSRLSRVFYIRRDLFELGQALVLLDKHDSTGTYEL